jgi:glycosyltransferase involved in cell wall biosynthesis
MMDERSRVRNIMLLGSALHIGGAERVIANLAKYLDPTRFNVTICHLKEEGAVGAELKGQGYSVVGVPARREGIQRYLSFRALAKLLDTYRIELVHTHTTYALTDSSFCRVLGLSAVRLIHTFHFGNYPNLPLKYRMMERLASRVPDRLVAVGQEQLGSISAAYGLPTSRLHCIVNGVEAVDPRPDQEWSMRLREDDSVIIGTICTFIEQKGLPDLVRVAQALKMRNARARFVVVGDGPLRAEIERQCQSYGLEEYLLFAGWKPNAAVSMMPLFDIFYQPSLWEAMSMVVLEAMAAGKPVVATDVGDNGHVVLHGETGYVVSPRDIDGMVMALQSLIGSVEHQKAFGLAARRRYEDKYTVSAMAREYESVYMQVLES